jgi:hypothetical protein
MYLLTNRTAPNKRSLLLAAQNINRRFGCC